ncbi:MAG: hypothetical protein ACYC8T_29640 [Myxococcaceae bacterium]
MAEQKGLGSKFIGLFVERDGDSEASPDAGTGREKTAAEVVAELAGQTGAPPPAVAQPGPPLNLKLDKMAGPTAGTPADFDAIFRDAGMDGGDLDRVKKAEDLLKSLPEATPQAVKKQIVEASLKAFGFEIDKIVLAAQNQRRALDAYVKVNENATAKAITDAEGEIRALNEKIAKLKSDIERRTASLGSLSTAAAGRKEQVQKVLEFFHAPATPAGQP